MTAFQRILRSESICIFFSLDGIVTEYEKWVLEMRRVWCNKQPKRNGWWFFEIVSQITFRSARVWARKLAIVRECVRVISCYRVSLLSLFQFVVHKIQVSESQTAGYVQKREIGSVYKSSMQAFQPKMSLNFNGKRASTVSFIFRQCWSTHFECLEVMLKRQHQSTNSEEWQRYDNEIYLCGGNWKMALVILPKYHANCIIEL